MAVEKEGGIPRPTLAALTHDMHTTCSSRAHALAYCCMHPAHRHLQPGPGLRPHPIAAPWYCACWRHELLQLVAHLLFPSCAARMRALRLCTGSRESSHFPPQPRCIEWPRHRNQGRRSAHTVRSHAQAHHPTKAPTGYQRPRHTACSAQLCLPIIPRRGQTQAGTHASAHGMLYTQRSRVPQCSAACLALQHETRQSIINMDSVGCGQCSGGYTTNGRK